MRLLAVLLLAGCTVGHVYTVDPAALGQDPVPAVRVKDGQAVRLRRGDIASVDGNRVKTKRYSPMVTAGSVLTWIGSAISIAGTIMFLATADGTNIHTAGLITAPSAEPIMITGTVLWIVGLIKHPSEVR